MRVLVTRPVEDSGSFAAALQARGHQTLIEPMLTIVQADEAKAPLDLNGVQAILFTSANGVRAFAGLSAVRSLPVFAVGEASARAAKDKGFAQVESADGDVTDLARLAAARLDPAAGALFHGAARQVAGDLKGLLEAKGFTLRRAILYEARDAHAFSEAARTALDRGEIDAVGFFSSRTAETFVNLVRSSGLARKTANLDAVCLSIAVADQVRVLSWRSVRVAARPNQDALLDCIDELAGARIDELAGVRQGAPAEETMPADTPDNSGDGSDAQEGPAHDIIAQFGGIRPMANKLGVAVSTVQGWRERGSIPAARHEQIAAAARSHGIALDAALLAGSDRHPDGNGESDAGKSDAGSRQARPETGQPWGAQRRQDLEAGSVTESNGGTAEERSAAGVSASQPEPHQAEPEAEPQEDLEAEPEAKAPAGRPWASAFLIAGLVFAAGAGGAVLTRDAWSPLLGGVSNESAERLSELERRIDRQERRAAAEMKTVQSAIAALRRDLESRGAALDADLSALRDGIASTNARLSTLGELADAAGDSEQLSAALAKMESRNAELADEVSALRREIADLAEEDAPPPASESAIALAVLQIRDALRSAEPFGEALNALDAQLLDAGGPQAEALRAAVAPLRPHAAQGAPSLEALQAEFPEVARAVIAQSHGGPGDDLLSNTLRRLSSLVSVRQVGQVEGDSAEAIVARAEAHLKDGSLAAAVRELDALSGPAAEAAEPWRTKAEARVRAQDALAKLGGLLAARRG